MHPLLVLVVILLFCISFPAVAGDCFDKPSNNKTYDNCATCYQTFANALVNTEDNKYLLSNAFFPIDATPPVRVEVTYVSSSNNQSKQTWHWLMGGFYVFQPLELFLHRSLFFSHPIWRTKAVTLTLPDICFGNSSKNDTEPDTFFKYTTQRVSIRRVSGVIVYR